MGCIEKIPFPDTGSDNTVTAYKHLRWTMDGPASSYSALVIHIAWKVEREAKIEPPIQTVFSFWWSDDLDLHGGWGKGGDFLLHTISNTWVHSGTTGEDIVSVEILTDINITLHDGVVGGFVNTSGFHTNE